ncbi:MAG: MBL fold metallo-hydrolase [Bacteroidota bacterium]|nr:MBL fold metallo-hydrolase [Bacteroidota bacterium]
MSLLITSLNSGSNGNCYYIGNEKEAILIDAGISCKETEKRMSRLNLPMKKLKAIFVSHEHSDHIKGIEVLSKKYQLPVYITNNTLLHAGLKLDKNLLRPFKSFEKITVGNLSIIAFPKLHDACDPRSFLVDCNDIRVGVFTDIGAPCEQVIKHFKLCHAAFLEANYDETMLSNGAYPYHLKRRISGGFGHLSNNQALRLFLEHRPSFMTHLLLSHLSKNNNCPNLVQELFNNNANGVQMIVASRNEETPVFHIQSLGISSNKIKARKALQMQIEFSFI